MASFRESGLCFEFSDQWEVYQLDQEADYRNKIEKKYLRPNVLISLDTIKQSTFYCL